MSSAARRAWLAAVVACAALALAACTSDEPVPTAAPNPPEVDVGRLPVERIASPPAMRVSPGVIPPTNRWYSSLAFSADDLPVYPFPMAFLPRPAGFSFGIPAVHGGPTTVGAAFTAGLDVELGDGQNLSRMVSRADAVSVTITYADASGPLAEVTLAEGSPLVALRALRDTSLTLSHAATAIEGGWSIEDDTGVFVISAPGASATASTIALHSGDIAQLGALPTGAAPAAWLDAIGAPVAGVTTTSSQQNGSITTTLRYTGAEHSVLVPFPGASADGDCDLGTYETPYGDVSACRAAVLSRTVSLLTPASRYDLHRLDAETSARIQTQLDADFSATGPTPADTYFGGKALARLAAMHELAAALGADDLADRIADRLQTELTPWLDALACRTRAERCFVYDDILRLVVGKAVGFGSEEGNDHHFHYGYFLFAAGVLGQARPDQLETLQPVMSILAADIVTGAADDQLPALRTFDPYRGHSWASGTAPFADGNNQESSSEAVAAWNGVAVWAQASDDVALAQQATWLLSTEADAARALWLEPDTATLPSGYAHTIVSLTWSAKRDYATWFSADPSAILGIQLLPLGPVSLEYLGRDPDRVAANVADAGDAAFTGPLGDYVAGYSALADADSLARADTAIGARESFDDGWSKALAQGWLAAVRLRE